MRLYCDCAAWKEGNAQLDAHTDLAYAHGIVYTGQFFKFCPWCGKKLKEDRTNEQNAHSQHGTPGRVKVSEID